jgi:dienelactone hydrolase
MPAQRRAPSRRATQLTAAVALSLALLVAACSSAPDRAQPSDQSTKAASPAKSSSTSKTTLFSQRGPFKVGVTTLQMGDTLVDVWYPAAQGAAAGKPKVTYELSDWLPASVKSKVPPGTAPFTTDAYRDVAPSPTGLFAHGYAGYRDQSTLITTHLASWGFIVAAPDFLSRDLAAVLGQKPTTSPTDDQVLNQTIKLLHTQSSDSTSELHDLVQPGKVAVIGHSAGGYDAIHFGANSQVLTYVSLAAGADTGDSKTAIPDKPSLYMSGSKDGVVPESSVADTYRRAPTPKRFVELPNSGHLVFSDICLIGAGQGGVLAIANSLGVTIPANLNKLATDGCEADRLDIGQATTVTNHFIVAQLRWAFGIDKTPIGLQASVTDQFPKVKFSYQQAN